MKLWSYIEHLERERDTLKKRQRWLDEVRRPSHPDDERPWAAAYLDMREKAEHQMTMNARLNRQHNLDVRRIEELTKARDEAVGTLLTISSVPKPPRAPPEPLEPEA